MTDKPKDPPNSPAWLIATNLEQKRTLVQARLADVAKAQKDIVQAEAEIARYEQALAAVRALPEATP